MSDRQVIEHLTEIVTQLEQVEQIHSCIIDSLIKLLSQHISLESEEMQAITEQINEAAMIRRERKGL